MNKFCEFVTEPNQIGDAGICVLPHAHAGAHWYVNLSDVPWLSEHPMIIKRAVKHALRDGRMEEYVATLRYLAHVTTKMIDSE